MAQRQLTFTDIWGPEPYPVSFHWPPAPHKLHVNERYPFLQVMSDLTGRSVMVFPTERWRNNYVGMMSRFKDSVIEVSGWVIIKEGAL